MFQFTFYLSVVFLLRPVGNGEKRVEIAFKFPKIGRMPGLRRR